MIRYGEGHATVVGAWASTGKPSFPVGELIPVDGDTVTAKLLRSGRPQRVDDYTTVAGPLAERLRNFGILSVVGAPIENPAAEPVAGSSAMPAPGLKHRVFAVAGPVNAHTDVPAIPATSARRPWSGRNPATTSASATGTTMCSGPLS